MKLPSLHKLKRYLLTRPGDRILRSVIQIPPVNGTHYREPKIIVSVSFLWYDLWIGAFFDRKQKQLYICPLPCVVIQIGYR